MNQPKPHSINFKTLVSDIEQGRIKIPQFQREFVWSKESSAKLIDSILKGYPIGTFILWKTQERLRSVRNIGGLDIPETPSGDSVYYVLDGQQRITSLFASIKGVSIKREKSEDNFEEMYIDLEATDEDDIVIIDTDGKNNESIVKLTELYKGRGSLYAKYDEKYHEKIDDYKDLLSAYEFSVIDVNNSSIDVATEIFTRLNVGGKSLTLFEIMVAKTYDMERNFDLSAKYDELIERLSNVNYDTIPASVVLQSVAMCIDKQCTKKSILKLDKNEFIDNWDKVADSIERTVDYFRTFFRIPVSNLLPYNSLIVPFTYYFYHHKDKPLDAQKDYLQDYFWRASLSERFSNATEQKLANDVKGIDDILNNKEPKYDFQVDIRPISIINKGYFNTSSGYIKSILCLYASKEPKSFIDDSIVKIDNNYLKISSSRNYHHFFPKAYLEKQGVDYSKINNVVNITLVDDFLNKRIIRAKDPAKYMSSFKEQNVDLDRTMKTHLINNLDEFGVWNNDYDKFIDKRAQAIHDEIKKRIIIRDIDIID